MKTIHVFFLISLLIVPFQAQATADGPDDWQVKPGTSANLHAQPSLKSPVIKSIPAGTASLKNMGCQGGPSFAEWSQMTPEQKKASREKRWCQMEYQNKKGWVNTK